MDSMRDNIDIPNPTATFRDVGMCVKLVKLDTPLEVVILVKLVSLSCKQLMPLGTVVTGFDTLTWPA